MNAPDEQTHNDDGADNVAEWLDGDLGAVSSESAADDERVADLVDQADRLDAAARRRAADAQLLHALLVHLYDTDTTRRNARVKNVMQRITGAHPKSVAGTTVVRPSTRRFRLLTGTLARWTVAACLIAAAAWWVYDASSNPAMAALEQVIQVLDRPTDRTYEITVERLGRPPEQEDRHVKQSDPASPRRKPKPRDGQDRWPRREPPSLNGALLYVRGSDQFVLYRLTRDGDVVVDGCDGKQSWRVRPNHPVQVSDDPNKFRVPMPQNVAPIPFVDIKTSLTQLREGYEIEELPAESPPNAHGAIWSCLRAQKRDPSQRGPKEISIWFHPKTHVLGRIVFDRVHLQGRGELYRMTIELIEQEELGQDFFEHEAHHDADCQVIYEGTQE